jgi:hypothetical protein
MAGEFFFLGVDAVGIEIGALLVAPPHDFAAPGLEIVIGL